MAGKRWTTLKDVAEQAGVSVMTVSAVLNGKATERRISAATQARVAELARRMGYQPNAVARSLRQRGTNVIGLYSGIGFLNASNPFLAELIGGLQEGCNQFEKDLLLHGTFRGSSVDDIYAKLLDGRLDGLVVQAPACDPLVARLLASGLPVVAVADAIDGAPSVVVDDAGGMAQLLDQLAGLGHRRLIFLGKLHRTESAARRCAAVLESARRLGLAVQVGHLEPGLDLPDGQLARWLTAPAAERATAVVAWSDGIACECIAHCRRLGLDVPADVAVTGFDGLTSQTRALTTIRAPWGEVGRTAVALLVEQIAGRPVPRETVLPVSFVRGETA